MMVKEKIFMDKTYNTNDAEFMERTKKILKTAINSLQNLSEKNKSSHLAEENFANFGETHEDKLSDFKNSLQKLQNARQEIYNYTFALNRQKNFDILDEIKQAANVMANLDKNMADLSFKYTELHLTVKSLENFYTDGTLTELLQKSADNLKQLGACEESIKKVSADTTDNFANIKSALDERITNAVNLEKEFLITCRELNKTTKNLTDVLSNSNSQQNSNLAIDSLSEKIGSRLKNLEDIIGKMAEVVPHEEDTASSEKIFENICKKISETIFNKESSTVYQNLQNAQMTNDEIQNLYQYNPGIHKKFATYAQAVNYYIKVYTEVSKILNEH